MKKLFTTISAFVLLMGTSFGSYAQGNAKQGQQTGEMCGSAIIHNRLMKNDPAYAARVQANEQQIQAIINQQKLGKGGPNAVQSTVYNIPVVVHVIHLGEAVGSGTNISDAQIQSAITNLTTAYRNQAPYNGIDIEVQFSLAQRDPNCNATNGINRVSGAGVSDYSTNGITSNGGGGTQNEITIKALSKWPSSTYYNIWVVAGIDGNMGGGGVQGYAYFPGAGSSVDGAVMLYNAFGYDPTGTLGYNLKNYTNHNGTAIHEMGHAFNLYHTFEGDDGNSDGTPDQCPAAGNGCGSGVGDCISDVPPHQRSMSTCNPGGTNACDGGSSNALFVHNWMDYSSDACKDQFTSDQKTRMRAAIIASRGSLVNSLAGTAPSGSMPTAACIPVVQNAGNFAIGVYGFAFNGLDVNSGTTNADGGYVDRTCYYQSTATAGSAITVTVNTGPTYQHDVRIYIDYNNDGDFADAGEQVFASDNTLTTHTGTITLSASPPLTNTLLRMRVYADYYTSNITGACMNPAYGQAEDYGITITPAAGSPPVANFSGSPTTLCVGSSVTYTDASSNSPTSWSWTFEGGSPATSSSQNPVISYTAAGTYSVSLQATNGSGSNTMNKVAYITVNGKPTVTASATSNPICSGSTTTLNGGGAVSYLWTGGATNGVAFAPGSTATYTVTGTDANGCTNTNTITVTVNATPTVNVAGTLTITSGGTTTLTASGGTTYSWTPGTGLSATTGAVVTANPTVTTAYAVTGTSGTCSGTKTFSVCVGPALGPTNIHPVYCGITVSPLSQAISCVPVNNATDYRYELTDISNGNIYTFVRGGGVTNFHMDWVTSVGYSKTYSIRVAAYVGGVWSAYGSACNVSTPAPPTTQLNPAYCGITETSLSQVLYCDAVTGATDYRYELTDLSNSSVTVYTRGGSATNLQMIWVSSVGYAKTYSIKVAAYVGSTWHAYGSACNVTTPSGPTTQLNSAYCGIVETSMTQVLYCDAVSGASNYRYELTDLSNNSVTVYTRGNATNLQMAWISTATYAKTYSIRVAAFIGTTWTSYGSACNVTTPAPPTTQLSSGYCNIVESTFAQTLYCDAVTGATQYRYEVVDISNGNTYTYIRTGPVTNFAMNWVTGVTVSKSYNVRVAAQVGGAWLPYGSTCSVTTAASIMAEPVTSSSRTGNSLSDGGISLSLYPNPNDGHVYLQVSTATKVVVTNLLGESVYEGNLKEGTNELYFVDTKPGMYIIRVSDGVNSTQVRMIKE